MQNSKKHLTRGRDKGVSNPGFWEINSGNNCNSHNSANQPTPDLPIESVNLGFPFSSRKGLCLQGKSPNPRIPKTP